MWIATEHDLKNNKSKFVYISCKEMLCDYIGDIINSKYEDQNPPLEISYLTNIVIDKLKAKGDVYIKNKKKSTTNEIVNLDLYPKIL